MLFKLLAIAMLFGCSPGPQEERIPIGRGIPQNPVPNLPPPIPVPRNPDTITVDILEDQILLDLNTLSDNDRLNSRYLISCNAYNAGQRGFNEVIAGTNKGINSISTESTLERVTPIGVGDCIYRIDLEDYGLTRSEWVRVEKLLLLDLVSESTRAEQIQFLTQSIKPYVFTNDFFVTTMQADALSNKQEFGTLYYDLVEQPLDNDGFFASLGINNVQREFDNEDVALAGSSQSSIALGKTRGYQVLDADDFFVVSTFDSSLGEEDSHFVNPFPKEAALFQGRLRSNKVFNFNAQEHIAFLPNGMLLFRLNGAGGQAETLAPNDVVLNTNSVRLGLDPTIYIGSCYGCHSGQQVMIPFRDQLAQHIASRGEFDADEKELGRIFYDFTVLEGRLRTVNQAHNAALDDLGARSVGEDPLTKIINGLRTEQNAEQVCGYMSLPLDVCLQRLAGADISSQIFGNLLNGGTVSFGTLSQNFAQLVLDLGTYRDNSL